MKNSGLTAILLVLLILLVTNILDVKAQAFCEQGEIQGNPPPGECNRENDSECCVQGMSYATYKCSPPVYGQTEAFLTLNSFSEGGDGGYESKCDDKYHNNDEPIVALSTGWYNGGSRCLKYITIRGNGKSVNAIVVDECDSTMGCDAEHSYQPPCRNNTVDASKAVWKALEVPEENWGGLDITWSDA